MRRPYAYLRKSRLFRDKRAVSVEMQTDEVTALAARYGETDLVFLEDMNISGKKGRNKRPGFHELLQAVEAGRVTAIYSYSLSRLSRSVRDIADLGEVCAAGGVPIHLVVDQDPDPTTASGKMVLTLLSAMAQFEADVASERARDTMEARRARGEKLGSKFFENTEAVIQAMKTAGSCFGAARLLTAQGVETRNGGAVWWASTVRVILKRVAPELVPRHGSTPGTKPRAPYLFYRLLRCSCGRTLTGVRFSRQGGYCLYRCIAGDANPKHGRRSIPEKKIVAWAMAEAGRLQVPEPDVQMAEDAAERQNALRDRQTRLGRAFVDKLIDEASYEAEKASIDREIALIDRAAATVRLERIDFDQDPALVNQALRKIWDHVELGPDLMPMSAEWFSPSWRTTI
jgi:DNA invertase Pin-like site-specific DNA recombinase